MKARFKVGDLFVLKNDYTFQRSFPLGGYQKDGSVRDIDQASKSAGSRAKISEVHDTDVEAAEASYFVDFGDLTVALPEPKLLELFNAV
jgi:hypothetical protein